MHNQICFHCGKDVVIKEGYKIYPLDRPYINILLHTSCYKEVGQALESLFTENPKLVYDYIEKISWKGKK